MATVTLKLTPAQAKVVYNVIDGQLDAGACEGGNTEEESEALSRVADMLLKQRDKWKSIKLQAG